MGVKKVARETEERSRILQTPERGSRDGKNKLDGGPGQPRHETSPSSHPDPNEGNNHRHVRAGGGEVWMGRTFETTTWLRAKKPIGSLAQSLNTRIKPAVGSNEYGKNL